MTSAHAVATFDGGGTSPIQGTLTPIQDSSCEQISHITTKPTIAVMPRQNEGLETAFSNFDFLRRTEAFFIGMDAVILSVMSIASLLLSWLRPVRARRLRKL